MPNQINPLLISKFVLWIVVIVTATPLLNLRKVTSKVRLAFLIGGVLVFGLACGADLALWPGLGADFPGAAAGRLGAGAPAAAHLGAGGSR